MPGTLVSSRSSTGMKPRLSVAIPAAAGLRASVFGVRPAATSRWVPEIVRVPFPCFTVKLTSPLAPSTDVALAPWRNQMPSSSRIWRHRGRDVVVLLRRAASGCG